MLVKNNYHQHRDIYALVPDKVCRLFVFNLFRPNPGRREKIKLNFYFYISLWCLKRFYEGLKGLNFFTLYRNGTLRVNKSLKPFHDQIS